MPALTEMTTVTAAKPAGTTSASGSGGDNAGGKAWDIASHSLGMIGSLVDMILGIKNAVSADKAAKKATNNLPIGQSSMNIPTLGR